MNGRWGQGQGGFVSCSGREGNIEGEAEGPREAPTVLTARGEQVGEKRKIRARSRNRKKASGARMSKLVGGGDWSGQKSPGHAEPRGA